MATQVEALLPGNPLIKAEERGKVRRGEPESELEVDGAKRGQAGSVAEEEELEPGSDNANRLGLNPGSPTRDTKGNEGGCDSEVKADEDDGKSRKDLPEAPPPKVNPWTRKMNEVTVVSVNGQAHHELTGPAKVVRAGNPPKARRGGKVGDFGDTNSWPTPGEIATKDMQIEAVTRTVSCPPTVRQGKDSWRSSAHKKISTKKETKEKRESNEESKENLKTNKSDDSGEEKNGDDDSHKNGQKKKAGDCHPNFLSRGVSSIFRLLPVPPGLETNPSATSLQSSCVIPFCLASWSPCALRQTPRAPCWPAAVLQKAAPRKAFVITNNL